MSIIAVSSETAPRPGLVTFVMVSDLVSVSPEELLVQPARQAASDKKRRTFFMLFESNRFKSFASYLIGSDLDGFVLLVTKLFHSC